MLGFFNPKCIGMTHIASNDETINGETITINANVFLDSDGLLIPGKKVLISVTDASLSNADIAQSSA